jgi:glycerol-3-phosphate dehydrogenase (NAD(P)+)
MRAAIIPAGNWGTALAVPLSDNGHTVRLWRRTPDFAPEFNRTRENRTHLPGVVLPPGVTAAATVEEALAAADLVVLAPASAGLREICRAVAAHLPPTALVLSVTKGLEPETLRRMSQVITEEIPGVAKRLAVLSGPNFAIEVARGLPATSVVAAPDLAVARVWQDALSTLRFRVYTSTDPVGVEIGGALKNVIAIGVGISDGLGMGQNARAGLITRGIAEMTRLGLAMGANPRTFAGLSGLGDLVLTCTGDLSRNRQAGLAIGRGKTLAQFLAETGVVVEGVPAARAAWQLAQRHGVDMPITEQIYAVLYQGKDPRLATRDLMSRLRTHEYEESGGPPLMGS